MREIVNVTFEDRTAALTQFGLSKILVFTNESDISYQESETLDGFTGVTAGTKVYEAMQAIMAQQKQNVAVFGSSSQSDPEIAIATIAEKDYFFIVPVGWDNEDMKKIAKYGAANEKMVIFSPVLNTAVDDIATLCGDIANETTGVFAHKGDSAGKEVQFAAAIAGRMAPKAAGAATWALQTPNGVPVNRYAGADETKLLTAKANIYGEKFGVGVVQDGTATNGKYLDITRDKFWLNHRLKEELGRLFITRDKVPFTPTGQTLIYDKIQAFCGVADTMGILRLDKTTITVPDPDALLSNDRANRKWSGIEIDTTIQGAVHEVDVKFVLNV